MQSRRRSTPRREITVVGQQRSEPTARSQGHAGDLRVVLGERDGLRGCGLGPDPVTADRVRLADEVPGPGLLAPGPRCRAVSRQRRAAASADRARSARRTPPRGGNRRPTEDPVRSRRSPRLALAPGRRRQGCGADRWWPARGGPSLATTRGRAAQRWRQRVRTSGSPRRGRCVAPDGPGPRRPRTPRRAPRRARRPLARCGFGLGEATEGERYDRRERRRRRRGRSANVGTSNRSASVHRPALTAARAIAVVHECSRPSSAPIAMSCRCTISPSLVARSTSPASRECLQERFPQLDRLGPSGLAASAWSKPSTAAAGKPRASSKHRSSRSAALFGCPPKTASAAPAEGRGRRRVVARVRRAA